MLRRPLVPEAIAVYDGILGLQQAPERFLLLVWGPGKALIDITPQQDVEFLHAAAAAPAQFPEVLRLTARCDHQLRRWAIICLISAIALAGFRSFGQASVQFMMVWQR